MTIPANGENPGPQADCVRLRLGRGLAGLVDFVGVEALVFPKLGFHPQSRRLQRT